MTESFTAESFALPRTRSCFVCGVENPHGLHTHSRVEGDRVVIEYTARASDCGYRRLVHGGIAMTLLDEAMTWAAILAAGRMCVAAELTTRLRRPMTAGDRLRIEARVVRHAGRVLYTEGAVLDAAGAVAASAEGKYMPMPAAQTERSEQDFLPGPELDAWLRRKAHPRQGG